MSVSDIAVTALTAVATVKGNALAITTSDPRSGALANLALDRVDIYASQTDTFASSSVVAQGTVRALHPNAGEEQTWYYWGIPYDKLGAAGTRYPAGATGGVACTSLGQAGLAFGLSNGKLVASVAANALTIAVKTAAGNDPSASDPVYIAFPNATLTTGNYQIRQIAAALSLTVSNGSILGVLANNLPFRLWVILFDDAGTLRLGVTLRSYQSGTMLPLNDGAIASAVAEGGAGGADGTLIYAAATVTSKTYRILGYCEWNSGLATAGAWAAAPDVVRLAVAGERPSRDVQEYYNPDVAANSASAVIPWDNTTPQIGEGTDMFGASVPMTAKSATNWFAFDIEYYMSHSAGGTMVLAVFRDSAASAIASAAVSSAAGEVSKASMKFRILAGSTSQRDFNFRFGPSTVAGTATINGSGAAAKMNGTLTSHIKITELMG